MTKANSVRLQWLGKGWGKLEPAGGAWARGYAFIGDGVYLEDDEIASYLAKNRRQLERVVAAMNGCFAAALDLPPNPVLITDRYGTIPIYIHRARDGTRAYASDEPWKVIETLESSPVLNPMGALDLLRTGYVTGTATLIQGIETVAPACIVDVERAGLRRQRYWHYGYRPETLTWSEAEDQLATILQRVAARSVRGFEARGYQGALTVSGGLDSRVLASIFSKHAEKPLFALSYGMSGDPEVEVAKQVASLLGMPHLEAAVTPRYLSDDFIDRSVREVGLTTRFTCGVGARHLKNFEADVFIPGHTGDFISGGHLPARTGMVRTRDQLRRYLELAHFRFRGSERALRHILRLDYPTHRWTTLESSTRDFDMSEDILGLIDRWNVENRQRRLILMELRAYESLGRWMLPFYDHELVDFFSVIPHEFRLGQSLYIQTARDRLFVDRSAALSDIYRVGSRSMATDSALQRRLRRLRQLQPLSGWALQLGFAEIRDLARAFRPKPEQVFGTDPLKRWFNSDDQVRNYVLDRVGSMNVDILDARPLRALLIDGTGEERIYSRLLPAALTVQACLDRAREMWSTGRSSSASSPARS